MRTFRLESVGLSESYMYNCIFAFDSVSGQLEVKNTTPKHIHANDVNLSREYVSAHFCLMNDDKVIVGQKVNGAYSAPFKLFLDITDRCQLNCKHCLNSELNCGIDYSYESLVSIAEECSSLGVFYVKLGGGEPLLHPRFLDIVSLFANAGCFVSTSTNGVAVTEYVAERMFESNTKVSVSLEGSRELDETIRGVGHFDSALKALRLLKKHKVNVSLRFTLTKFLLDIAELEKCIILGVENNVSVKFSYCRPSGSALQTGCMIAYEDFENYNKAIEFLNRPEYEKMVILDEGMQSHQKRSLSDILYHNRVCGAANRSMHINAAGNISPCIFLGKDFLENIQYTRGDIRAYWTGNKGTAFQRIRDVKIPAECEICPRLCKAECLATRLVTSGSFYGSDPNCLKKLYGGVSV